MKSNIPTRSELATKLDERSGASIGASISDIPTPPPVDDPPGGGGGGGSGDDQIDEWLQRLNNWAYDYDMEYPFVSYENGLLTLGAINDGEDEGSTYQVELTGDSAIVDLGNNYKVTISPASPAVVGAIFYAV